MNNVDELIEKMNEVLSVSKRLHVEVVDLRANVESLQRTVDDLRERLTYRERVLVGWKEIATYLGFSDTSQARRLSDEAFDPLPVWREGQNIVARATALDAYKERRRDHKRIARLVPRESTEPAS